MTNIGHNSNVNATSEAITAYVESTIAAASALVMLAIAITAELGSEWWNLKFYPKNKRSDNAWKKGKSARFHAIFDELIAAYNAKGKSNPSMALKALRAHAKKTAAKQAADKAKQALEAKLAKMSPAARAKAEAEAAKKNAKPTKAMRHTAAVAKAIVTLAARVDGEKGLLPMSVSYALQPLVTKTDDKLVLVSEVTPDIVREMAANLAALVADIDAAEASANKRRK